jgi:hypothetical protein
MASHFGVRPEVDVKKVLVDPGLRWTATTNIWYNAQIRSLIYAAAAPIRRFGRRPK